MPPLPPKPKSALPLTPVPEDSKIETVSHQKDITPGTKVPISINGKQCIGSFVSFDEKYNQSRVLFNNTIYRRTVHGFGKASPRADIDAEALISNGKTVSAASRDQMIELVPSRFDVNQRFEFIEELTDMVVQKNANSLVVSGSGGLGKSFTVLERLKLAKKKSEDDVKYGDPYDYTVCKGFSTPKALYRLLWQNREKLVIFDDCDSIQDDPAAVNLLKAGLDSYETRWIHWLSEKAIGADDDELPLRFEFEGQIIFISNRRLGQIDQALLSRSLFVDVTMTPQEKIDRITTLLPRMEKDMKMTEKIEVVELLKTHMNDIKDLNIRTFLKVAGLRKRSKKWSDIGEYMVTANF